MRYESYGAEELHRSTESRQRVRVTSGAPGISLAGRSEAAVRELDVPRGITEQEAAFVLGIFARLKEKRFGRVELTVREGVLTGVEFIEKMDRNLFQYLGR